MYTTAEENDFTFDDLHPDSLSECDYCTEPSDDLECVESGDPAVGYRESQWLCAKCRKRGKQ